MPELPARTVRVDLGPRSYDIAIGRGGPDRLTDFTREALGSRWSGRGCRSALLVTDTNVEPIVGPWRRSLEAAGLATELAVVPAGESSKSFEQAAGLYDRLVEGRADRHTLIVAAGGGVVGDLAGFVAATFARGLPLLMIPTSLLAQVDSSVGGKVGVNRPGAKNIVGAFHQPIGVWIETDVLASLPVRELRCGLAEVIKYGVILDAAFFEDLETRIEGALGLDAMVIERIVARSCELKADVVTRDEREETGLRAVLNFGHTIGHAIEAVAGYGGPYLHGEAVTVGMMAESRMAERMGWIGPEVTGRLRVLLERAGLPIAAPGLDPAALRAAMAGDKKNRGGRVRFVLPRRIGEVELTDAASEEDLRGVLDELVG